MTAFAQSKSADAGSVTSANLTFTNPVLAGSLIVVVLRISANGRTITVTDDHSDSYSAAVAAFSDGQGDDIAVYFAQNVAGGTTTPNVAISGAATSIRWAIHEYSAAGNAVSVDQEAHTPVNQSGTTPSVGPVTTVQGDELVFTYIDQGLTGAATATPNSGTKREEISISGALKLTTADQVVSSTGSFSSAWTLDASGAGLAPGIVTFKVAGTTAAAPAFYRPIRVPNPRVGPMALRQLFRQPYLPVPSDPPPPGTPIPAITIRIANPNVGPPVLRRLFRQPQWPTRVDPAGGPQPIVPAAINATSSMSATVSKLAAITPAAVNATSSVTATVSKQAAIIPAAVNATSTVSGTVSRRLAIAGAVNATSTISGAVIRLVAINSAINATSPITATINVPGNAAPIENSLLTLLVLARRTL